MDIIPRNLYSYVLSFSLSMFSTVPSNSSLPRCLGGSLQTSLQYIASCIMTLHLQLSDRAGYNQVLLTRSRPSIRISKAVYRQHLRLQGSPLHPDIFSLAHHHGSIHQAPMAYSGYRSSISGHCGVPPSKSSCKSLTTTLGKLSSFYSLLP